MIKEILGVYLEKKGFEYGGYDNEIWIYERAAGEIKQRVYIDDINVYSTLKIYLGTMPQLYPNIYMKINSGKVHFYDPMDGYLYGGKAEDFKAILEVVPAFIEESGLKKLEQNSIEASDRPQIADYLYFYQNHKNLEKQYREKIGLVKGTRTFEESAEILQETVNQLKGKDFVEVSQELIGLAAVCGGILLEYCTGEWEWNDERKNCWIDLLRSGMYPLDAVFVGWESDTDEIKDRLVSMIKRNMTIKM